MSKMLDKKDLDEGRCKHCEYCQIVTAVGWWQFAGCFHPPYRGKWVAEIKDCPTGITAEPPKEES